MRILILLLLVLVNSEHSLSISLEQNDLDETVLLQKEETLTLLDIANELEQYHLFQVLGIEAQDRQMKRLAVASIISILTIAACCGCSQIIQAYSKSCKQKLPPPKNQYRRLEQNADSL
ncbi:unnamed protein product (macronuclear) [Paramecium tetraurelia]|uniref:Uncharacterized protein n=1 Tax=Paramecium tetraurelia TaxID=5888 RepID=A0C567_PARTE|nr:uncharacterized protein GSPATT00006433001 [Paramecium tetraurelia]CAK65934.1 unnamed protein product [Paramecium tetraurelia]|eukprot:XP_001433331.1 hypothetical protein (macronuclear) [Paramecium tetraurelia strain d4-2]